MAWATWTCVLGFPVMGIWRLGQGTDGTDVNAVSRSYPSSPGLTNFLEGMGQVLVTGSDDGMVRLFNYPCVVEGAPCRRAAAGRVGIHGRKRCADVEHTRVCHRHRRELRGHAAHVANVRVSPDNALVVSVGGRDRAVMQWRVLRAEQPAPPKLPSGDNFVYERPLRVLVAQTVPLADQQKELRRRDAAAAAEAEAEAAASKRRKVDMDEVGYEVAVYTSDIRGAGTDANVYIVLMGPKGSTPVSGSIDRSWPLSGPLLCCPACWTRDLRACHGPRN